MSLTTYFIYLLVKDYAQKYYEIHAINSYKAIKQLQKQ